MSFQLAHDENRCNRCRQTAGAEPRDDAPIDVPAGAVCRNACNLRQRGEYQIRTNGDVYGDLEEEHQNRRHQRSAADTRQPDDQADH